MTEAGLLLVDVGNSRIKWAIARSESLEAGVPFAYSAQSPVASLDAHWGAIVPPRKVWLSNVGAVALADAMASWMALRWPGSELAAVTTPGSDACGVTTRYEMPDRLGVDRWLALLGARASIGGAVCVVDCGTAITLDVMDGHGVHLGGLIAPGLKWLEQGISQQVPALVVAPSDYQGVLATNTAAGLLSGALQAALGLIERTFADVALLLGGEPALILTGGDADLLRAHLRIPSLWRPHLVLEGLKLFAESNR